MNRHQKHTFLSVFMLPARDLVLLLAVLCCGMLANAQQRFLTFGPTTIGLGTTSGIQPNYRLGEGNNFLYGTLEQQFSVKGIPFQAVGRLSDEPYLSGRASYFRISYQGMAMKKQNLDSLQLKMAELEKQKLEKQQGVYDLEGKLSYLNFILLEYPKGDSVPLPNLPNTDSLLFGLPTGSLPSGPNMPAVGVPGLPSVAFPDTLGLSALDKAIALASFALKVKQLEVQKLDSSMLSLKTDYQKLSMQKYDSFFKGISKVDIGLSSLPSAHLSSNAIPIQGVKVRGKYRNWTYSAAAGLTIPNKVYSNVALDQVLNNSANLFNLSNFYQVNTVRLAAATTLEYGDVGKNSVFIEDFYTGPSIEKFKAVSSAGSSNATNIGAYYTPKFAPNLTVSGTVGFSINADDTVNTAFEKRLATSAELKYGLPRLRGEFASKYRNIGPGYNGFAQGIYISGVRHYESSYRQAFFNRLVAKITGARDEFANKDSLVRVSYINQATLDLTCKLGDRSVIYSSGTLLQTDVTSAEKYSYQLRLGVLLEKEFKKVLWYNNLESSYAKILGTDSNQILAQASFKSGITLKHWGYAVKGTVQRFEGLNKIYGTNVIIQPELSYRYQRSTFSINGQYLISEQFGEDQGLSLNWMFQPSPFFQWKLTAQRWLVSETTFFLTNPNFTYRPFYLNFQMLIFLKNKKE